MQEILVDSGLSDQLQGHAGQLILRGPDGTALGFFSPLPEGLRVKDLQLEPLLSIAETEELRKTRTGRPLSEILERLGIQ